MSFFVAIAHAAETAHESTGGFGALGVNLEQLLFQVVNFAIVLFILSKVAYRPILKLLEDRRSKVEASLKTAEALDVAKQELTKQQKIIIEVAHSKAEAIIEQGNTQAKAIINEAESQARQRVEHMIKEAELRIEQSTEDARKQLRREIIDLVALATEQILQQKIDPAKDEAIIRQTVDQLSRHKASA